MISVKGRISGSVRDIVERSGEEHSEKKKGYRQRESRRLGVRTYDLSSSTAYTGESGSEKGQERWTEEKIDNEGSGRGSGAKGIVGGR